MEQKTILWIFVVIVIAIGAYTLVQSNSGEGNVVKDTEVKQDDATMVKDEGAVMNDTDDASMQKKDDSSMKEEGTMVKDESVMMQKGSYETYAASKLAMADKGHVVLFFRASWCPTCKALDADIRAHLSDIPNGLTILDVDYDNSTALKQKYGVTYQHTLVQVKADGSLVKKWSGSPNLASLVAQVQ